MAFWRKNIFSVYLSNLGKKNRGLYMWLKRRTTKISVLCLFWMRLARFDFVRWGHLDSWWRRTPRRSCSWWRIRSPCSCMFVCRVWPWRSVRRRMVRRAARASSRRSPGRDCRRICTSRRSSGWPMMAAAIVVDEWRRSRSVLSLSTISIEYS